MEFKEINASNKGLPYDLYYKRILGRSDLELDVTHLTKPAFDDLKLILLSCSTHES